MNGFQGKTVVIAGGGRGIGQAIANKFAQYGCSVIVGSRTMNQVEETVKEIKDTGVEAFGYYLDVSDRKSVQVFFEQAKLCTGQIDHFVYVAGMNKRSAAEAYSEEDWEQIMNVNLTGAYRCCQEAGKIMIAQGGGTIVTITSMLSHIATPNQSAYSASKGGLLQYTKVLAVEWAKHQIRVNAVSPGYIETELNSNNFKNQVFRENVLGKTPMERFGELGEVADAVCYLSSPAASFITGACIPVDGGYLAGHPAIKME